MGDRKAKKGGKKPAAAKAKASKQSSVVEEEESGESEGAEEGGSSPSLFAAFEGGESPDVLQEALDAKVSAIEQALATFRSQYGDVTSAPKLKKAQAALDEIQEQVTLLETFAEAFEGKGDAIKALMESEELESQDDESASLYNRASEIQDELSGVRRAALTATARLDEKLTEQIGRIGLAEDEVNASGAASAKLTELRGLWTTPAEAKGHFKKHQSDTGAADELEYLTWAKQMSEKVKAKSVLTKVGSDKRTRAFDTATKMFSSLTENGKIVTFFKPSRGKKYYDDQ